MTSIKKRMNFKKAIIIAVVITISDLVILSIGISNIINPLASSAAIGIITFFGMLILTNILSRTKNLDKGEIRKSLAAAIITVYFSLLAFHGEKLASDTIVGHFTYIVGIVVAFYFGSRAIESARRIHIGNNESNLDEADENLDESLNKTESKLCVITAKDKEGKISYLENPEHREPMTKWNKSEIKYALIKGTRDIKEESDTPERIAMNLAILTWSLEVNQKFKSVKKDENPDITVDFRHPTEDNYLARRKSEGVNILGYAFPPGHPEQGTLVINDDYRWSITGKPVLASDVAPQHYEVGSTTTFTTWNLTSTLIHELGHTIGMPHILDCPECVMYDKDNSNVDLHEKEIKIIQEKYGKTTIPQKDYERKKEWLKQRVRRDLS